jgi:hypothetical protein
MYIPEIEILADIHPIEIATDVQSRSAVEVRGMNDVERVQSPADVDRSAG